jgi:hypothetical protein
MAAALAHGLGCTQLLGDSYTLAGSGGGGSCHPAEGAPIGDDCGVFVSSSLGDDATGDGSRGAPYKTLRKAIADAGNQRDVIACGEVFEGAVIPPTPTTLRGGFRCEADRWTYSQAAAQRSTIRASADTVALTISAKCDTFVYDFVIEAVDATTAGGSSIAVIAEAGLTLTRVEVKAGDGVAGSPGGTQVAVTTPLNANGGDAQSQACDQNSHRLTGGKGGVGTCDGVNVSGGDGSGQLSGAATNGLPPGNGGHAASVCPGYVAGAGTPGAPGKSGAGAHAPGDLGGDGYHPPYAESGGEGGYGQGGGGGARISDNCAYYSSYAAAGGGAGGCGGAGGLPGQSGGSSIGIVTTSPATLVLATVSIKTGKAGDGGAGGLGQVGGDGGKAGSDQPAGYGTVCSAGNGGKGGDGGVGGDGAGGHSLGIAIRGGALPALGSPTFTLGEAGNGTPTEDGGAHPTAGDPGLACKVFDFANPGTPLACTL